MTGYDTLDHTAFTVTMAEELDESQNPSNQDLVHEQATWTGKLPLDRGSSAI